MYFEQPVPFYVAYPFTSYYEDEKTAQTEMDMMKSYFPKTSAKIQAAVEAECDRMEYDGSMMYDEYPDAFMISTVCRRIQDKICAEEGMEEELFVVQERYRAHSTPVQELIRVLLCHEIFGRRCKRRRARRYF